MMSSMIQGRAGFRYVVVAIVFLLAAATGVFFWRDAEPARPPPPPAMTPPTTSKKIEYVPSSRDWSKARIYNPLPDAMKLLPTGTPKKFPKVQATQKAHHQSDDEKLVVEGRRQAIKDAFVKSWRAYETYAWGMDELMPLSGKGKTSFSGWAAQLVDALDTLWIMGLEEEFERALEKVAVIDWSNVRGGDTINLFEVTIRYLGGLVAAHDLSGHRVLLDKAVELADTLYMAFDTPNRLPTHWLNLDLAEEGKTVADFTMSAAAGGTLCLEFTRLSQITGDPKYYDATERIKQFFYRFQNETRIPGLWPQEMSYREEYMVEKRYTLSGGADSMYEYLPKMHVLLGGLDPQYEEMTARSLETIRDHLLFRPMTPNDEDILFSGSSIILGAEKVFAAEMDHLTCFAGGMYALAGKLLSREDFVNLAARLTAGCVWEYDAMPTNIMPEGADFVACANKDGPCPVDEQVAQLRWSEMFPGFVSFHGTAYLQRPEAIESVFYMWRITGEQVWRDAAWRMWEGIVRETETDLAFASIKDVTTPSGPKADSMETFWLAETLKYFYLIFEDEGIISLDEWVFNTEAHPFRRT